MRAFTGFPDEQKCELYKTGFAGGLSLGRSGMQLAGGNAHVVGACEDRHGGTCRLRDKPEVTEKRIATALHFECYVVHDKRAGLDGDIDGRGACERAHHRIRFNIACRDGAARRVSVKCGGAARCDC